jgi:ketosteroid isomerase-like protein
LKRTLFAAVLVLAATPAFADDRDDVMAADRAFSSLSVAKGSNAAFLAVIADDARLFGNSGPPSVGKAAIAAEFAKAVQDPKAATLSWRPDAAGVSPDGNLGWTDGHWVFRSGKTPPVTGHYMTVWVKRGGIWKVQADMGTVDAKPSTKKS